MSDTKEIEMKELKLQAEIDKRIGDLVGHAEKLITDRSANLKQIDAGSQLRNVMAVANTAPHPAVVVNFIRYQIGRSTTAKTWKVTGLSDKDTGLGEAVLRVIEGELQKLANEAVTKVSHGDKAEVQMRMIRLMLGFMIRCYVYEDDKAKSEKQR